MSIAKEPACVRMSVSVTTGRCVAMTTALNSSSASSGCMRAPIQVATLWRASMARAACGTPSSRSGGAASAMRRNCSMCALAR